MLDESALTGEPLPVTCREAGRSGAARRTPARPSSCSATRPASESAYAAIVRLVREAESHKAPFVRMADRYAAFFLPVTLVVAGLAWALSGDPVRGLAVLVVATPCPLILAAPVAILSGVSRAARAGVIVKGGAAVEQLGEARTVVLDKTGTLTLGTPEIERVVSLRRTRARTRRFARRLARPALGPLARRGARPRRPAAAGSRSASPRRSRRARPGRRGARRREAGRRRERRLARPPRL